jgi:hypothetical protein
VQCTAAVVSDALRGALVLVRAGDRQIDRTALATHAGQAVEVAEAPARDVRDGGVRSLASARDHLNRAPQRVGTEARRQRSAHHLDAVDVVDAQRREVEGAAARIGGIVHHDPVDQHQDVIRVEAADVHRRAAAACARLFCVQARAMTQHLEHAVVASGFDLGAGYHVDAARKLRNGKGLARSRDDEGFDIRRSGP